MSLVGGGGAMSVCVVYASVCITNYTGVRVCVCGSLRVFMCVSVIYNLKTKSKFSFKCIF